MEAPVVISARGLTKKYSNTFLAVDDIEFAIHEGECFGFLGPNGAGKTTTMKMITCFSPVTDGELKVKGMDVQSEQRNIKTVLGIVSQSDSLDPDLSVFQNLQSYGRYFNLPREVINERTWDALDLFQLKDRAHQKPDELSGGMRRRLLIARSLLNDPSILVLDEPSTGLDPQTRLLVWEKLVYIKSQGITILLTTHYMEEAAYLCDRLVVMDGGKIIAQGAPEELIHKLVGDLVYEIRVRFSEKMQLIEDLKGKGINFEDRGDSIFLYSENGALSNGVGLDGYQVTQRPGNLEDVFLRLTGRGLREE